MALPRPGLIAVVERNRSAEEGLLRGAVFAFRKG